MSASPPEPHSVPAPQERVPPSGMLRRFGPLYTWTPLGWLLGRLRLSERSAERVRQAAERGPVVYVLHSWSRLDWLALNQVLNAHRLPLARHTFAFRSSLFAPMKEMLRGLAAGALDLLSPRVRPEEGGWLRQAVSAGAPGAIFLVQRQDLAGMITGERQASTDPLEVLVDAQRDSARPIQLVPVVVLWSRSPEAQVRSGVMRQVLGSADEPSWVRKLFSRGWGTATEQSALVEVGEPVDLAAFLARKAEEPRPRQVKTVRLVLRRYLYQTAHVIRGPGVRPYRWMRRLVLDSPEVRRLVDEEALATRRSPEQVRAKVAGVFDHMAARLDELTMRAANRVVHVLWSRIYAGIDVREEDLERIREALRKGTPVLIPCHRSHLDYLLISSLLYAHDIFIPHVVAGENLSFWPAGPIARRLGAVFIRRSFKGDRVFPVVFQRYLKQLLRDGFPVEFFIEGTRSRSGKLLPARLGVLGMVLDAAAEVREGKEVTLLPIAISYEQIAEEKSYARELQGEAKKPEDIAQLAAASKVVNRRYGRVYLRVGEPIPVRPLLDGVPGGWASLDRDHRHELLQDVGERVMHRIARSMVVLPTGLVAMALLASARRGIRHAELFGRCERMLGLLVAEGAVPAVTLSALGWAMDQALHRFQSGRMIARIQDEEGEILQVVDQRRMTLEYYKNGAMYVAVPASLLASAVAARCLPSAERPVAPGRADDAEVSRLFRLQVFLLRYEFALDPERTLEAHQARARAALLRYGALVERDGELALGDPTRLAELAGLTRNFIESYLLVLRAARTLRSRDISVDDLPRRIQEIGKGLLAVDELRRPESLSMENLKNAVRALREEGVLQVKVGGGGLQFEDAAHRQYSDDLLGLLGRAPVSAGPA